MTAKEGCWKVATCTACLCLLIVTCTLAGC